MKLKVHMFGVAKEIFGNRIVEVNVENAERLYVLTREILNDYL